MDSGPSDGKNIPAKREKRKLACAACRARRIRCEWPTNGAGCVACGLAELRCPGEPEPRKRSKKGATSPPSHAVSTVNKAQAELEHFTLGGALTFHLIESLFVMANPSIPGMSYWLMRDLLHAAGGSSKEMEIAAECLCSAFIASSATFSDHATIIGPSDAEMPTDLPGGTMTSYDSLATYGSQRRKAVATLADRAINMFEESGIKDRPGVETIYTMLALDQCSTLTTDGGRKSRDFVLGAVNQLKHLLDRHAELPSSQLEALQGSLGYHLLCLDAQTAAILRSPCAINDTEIFTYFPHIDLLNLPRATLDTSQLVNDEEGWSELGKQLAPVQIATLALYRAFIGAGPDLLSASTISQLWEKIDEVMGQLAEADAEIESLPSLDTKEATDHRQFDLLGLTNSYRRNLLRLDLLVHQRIVEAALAAEGNPDATVLQDYEVSRERVQQVFVVVSAIAKQNVFNRSLLYVRRLFEMLEVCSTWTSLRTADHDTAAELVAELGITDESGAVLLQALALAAWSSPLAAQQRQGLRIGLGEPVSMSPPQTNGNGARAPVGMVGGASPPQHQPAPAYLPPPSGYVPPYHAPAASQLPLYPSFPQPTPHEMQSFPRAHTQQQYMSLAAYSQSQPPQPPPHPPTQYPSFPTPGNFASSPYQQGSSVESSHSSGPIEYQEGGMEQAYAGEGAWSGNGGGGWQHA